MGDLSAEDLNNPNLQGIEVGSIAPDFSMVNVCSKESELFTLSEEVIKHKGNLLVFFRGEF